MLRQAQAETCPLGPDDLNDSLMVYSWHTHASGAKRIEYGITDGYLA